MTIDSISAQDRGSEKSEEEKARRELLARVYALILSPDWDVDAATVSDEDFIQSATE